MIVLKTGDIFGGPWALPEGSGDFSQMFFSSFYLIKSVFRFFSRLSTKGFLENKT